MGEWKPTPGSDRDIGDVSLNEWVGQALGAASTCWENLNGAGVFDSSRCGEIFDALMAHLNEVIDGLVAGTTEATAAMTRAAEGARLGLASTRELLHELEVRGAVGRLAEENLPHVQPLRMMEHGARELRTVLPAAVLDYRTVGQ